MSIDVLCKNAPGDKVLLLGNEAFSRGILEAGIRVAVGYPGTPSSEIIDRLGDVKVDGVYIEWSVNEKVAFEVAYAAAISGVRSAVTTKSVGLNVALDPLMVMNAAGVESGLVIIVADDPAAHSSQNEQDCRLFAAAAEIPVLEPCNAQEAKECISVACELSEKSKLPVMVRSVTRLSHSRGDVILGQLPTYNGFGAALNEKKVYTTFPGLAYHDLQKERFNTLKKYADSVPLNKNEATGKEKIGVITSGVGYEYAKYVIKSLGLEQEFGLLKIGISNPLPNKLITDFIKMYDTVLVLEDGFPYIEGELKKLTYYLDYKPLILGKESGHLPETGELSPDLIKKVLNGLLNEEKNDKEEMIKLPQDAPLPIKRGLSLCAGCAHLAMWYAMKQAVKKGKLDVRKGSIVCGDIGCYGLGQFEPYNMFNSHMCMGASIGIASGMGQLHRDKPVFAYLGDGTFFHSGMPGLLNAVFNKSKLILIVQDNLTTGMTGHQENPGVGFNLMGEKVKPVKIEKIAEAMEVPFVKVVDPYNIDDTIQVLKEAIKVDGPAVIVARRKCAELAKREVSRNKAEIIMPKVDHELCNGCKICSSQLRCPALIWDEDTKKVSINDILCVNCNLCQKVCTVGAISSGRGGVDEL